jgi:hypothetical protein
MRYRAVANIEASVIRLGLFVQGGGTTTSMIVDRARPCPARRLGTQMLGGPLSPPSDTLAVRVAHLMAEKEAATLSDRLQYLARRSPAYRHLMVTPDHYLAAFDPEVITTIESFLEGEIQRMLKRARSWVGDRVAACLNRRLTSAAPASMTDRTPRLLAVSRLRKRQPPRRNWYHGTLLKHVVA